jgi:D-inositol-3-phosphate glycosyltransferase
MCAFSAGLLRAEAGRPAGWFDLIHSHYWLSGQVGWLASERWDVPLVHSNSPTATEPSPRCA